MPLLEIAQMQPALRDLFDIPVEVKPGAAIPAKAMVAITVFSGCPSLPEVLAVADVNLVNYLGAALVRIPAPEAARNAKEGTMPKESLENYYEVMNILCGLLSRQYTCHLAIKGFFLTCDKLPADYQGVVNQPSQRDDFEVSVKGYGAGKLALLQR